jgi:hypothetical protein
MLLYILDKKLDFADMNFVISEFHLTLFHGSISEEKDGRLLLVKNGYMLADIFQPAAFLVGSQAICDKLAPLTDVEFREVQFEKLFNYPIGEGHVSYRDLVRRYPDWDSFVNGFIASQAHDAELAARVGKYYHVVPGRPSGAVWHRNDVQVVRLDGLPATWHFPEAVDMSERLLQRRGMLWDQCLLLTEPVFDVLRPHLREPYFNCAVVDTDQTDAQVRLVLPASVPRKPVIPSYPKPRKIEENEKGQAENMVVEYIKAIQRRDLDAALSNWLPSRRAERRVSLDRSLDELLDYFADGDWALKWDETLGGYPVIDVLVQGEELGYILVFDDGRWWLS